MTCWRELPFLCSRLSSFSLFRLSWMFFLQAYNYLLKGKVRPRRIITSSSSSFLLPSSWSSYRTFHMPWFSPPFTYRVQPEAVVVCILPHPRAGLHRAVRSDSDASTVRYRMSWHMLLFLSTSPKFENQDELRAAMVRRVDGRNSLANVF